MLGVHISRVTDMQHIYDPEIFLFLPMIVTKSNLTRPDASGWSYVEGK